MRGEIYPSEEIIGYRVATCCWVENNLITDRRVNSIIIGKLLELNCSIHSVSINVGLPGNRNDSVKILLKLMKIGRFVKLTRGCVDPLSYLVVRKPSFPL